MQDSHKIVIDSVSMQSRKLQRCNVVTMSLKYRKVYIGRVPQFIKKEAKNMGMFKSNKGALNSGPDIPIDQVNAMKAQGYTNNQIIQSLQRDGYTSSQIFDAISQSEMMAKGQPDPTTGATHNMMQQAEPAQMSQQNTLPPMSMPQMPMPPGPMSMQMPMGGMGGPSTEEIVEAIIDEKWNELVKDINKVIEWKQKADTRLASMEQQMNDLKEQFDKLHTAILGRIGDYDKHMSDVGAELQAMEKVFSKVLPGFVDNVNELSRITEKMKTTTPGNTKLARTSSGIQPGMQSTRSKRINLEDEDQE